MDTSYTISNAKEALDDFIQLIVRQSIFALRYCSMDKRTTVDIQPYMLMSTVFSHIRNDAAQIYFIYQLIPLSVMNNNTIYSYSNLPKLVGINVIDGELIVWNKDSDLNNCTFTPIF
ncbi:unnamed protein product [Rotaria magnacalcarata]|uniref:Uncharacterized protein n=1 Tax=Rotaria magnacalcarata TaxID=392030 RepID=A0A814MC22_9BILA|nr:unnamed protein product [Rotaria magnacalcarata]CAF1610079.1 unnamed protein product [Rotaria magnacalcarata]CAF2104561.1 unnamed protein product [Rotaria magnacalcarata]CAF2135045.1 unnamed protein product [Rotaria magnacalcarata]CAF2151371.1 unnamed protein product [Rotaria magnacalcarata]